MEDPERFYRSGVRKPKKYEARNPKSETNSKSKYPMFKTNEILYLYSLAISGKDMHIRFLFGSFEFKSFEFVSNFEI